ncbi:hypothetical protein D3C73_1231030 [compost metagenome]
MGHQWQTGRIKDWHRTGIPGQDEGCIASGRAVSGYSGHAVPECRESFCNGSRVLLRLAGDGYRGMDGPYGALHGTGERQSSYTRTIQTAVLRAFIT